jgi:hypothetical protein
MPEQTDRLRRVAHRFDQDAELDAALDAVARDDSVTAIERLARLDQKPATVPSTRPEAALTYVDYPNAAPTPKWVDDYRKELVQEIVNDDLDKRSYSLIGKSRRTQRVRKELPARLVSRRVTAPLQDGAVAAG